MTATVSRPRTGATKARLDQAARCRELRDQGLLQREIADRLGLKRGWVSELLTDPDGTRKRARIDSYAGMCADCGGPTSGSEGPNNIPERCLDCATKHLHDDRYWTREAIVESFQRFATLIGRSPSTVDRTASNPSIAVKLSPERVAEADQALAQSPLPHPAIVNREFGSWGAALQAAGLPANRTGGAGHRGPRRNRKGAPMARIYHVLHRNGDGGLHDTQVEAYSAENAIEKAADSEGEWIAVLDSHWVTASTEQRQVFAVVKPAS